MGNGCPTACEAVVEGFDSPRSPQGMAERARRGAGKRLEAERQEVEISSKGAII